MRLITHRDPTCTEFVPVFQKAAYELQWYNVTLAKVDATTEVELADQHNITAYPTLKIFKRGKSFDFSAPFNKRGRHQ